MSYSIGVKAAGADVIVYRFPASDVLSLWPKECIDEIKIGVLEKY
jgi:hypothetical protein